MNETLEKVKHDLEFVVGGLIEAHFNASALESMVIIPMKGAAQRLLNDVIQLIEARKESDNAK